MKDAAPNLLTPYGIHCQTILRNASPAILYEEALLYETDSAVSDTGAPDGVFFRKNRKKP